MLYPVTIIYDRYHGTYSGGIWTAWNMYENEVPEEASDDDVICMCFWQEFNGAVGRGNTPNEAYLDLQKYLKEHNNKHEKNF